MAVQPDVAGDDAAVPVGALHPGIGVVDNPVAVRAFAGAQIGVQHDRGNDQVARRVADHVPIGREVLDVVVPRAMPAQRREAPLAFERVASPVDRGGGAQHRAAAAGHDAADQTVLPVVVGRARVLTQIEAGVAAHARPVGRVPWLGQPLLEQPVEALGVVHGVEAGRELLVVHAAAGQRALGGARFRVLPHVALDAVPIQLEHALRAAERVELGPAGDVLRRVVGAVQRPPTRIAQQVAALVEVPGVERLDRLRQRRHQSTLQQRPMRRRQRRRQFQSGLRQAAVVHGPSILQFPSACGAGCPLLVFGIMKSLYVEDE